MTPAARASSLVAFIALCAFSSGARAQFNFDFNKLIDTAKNLGKAGQQVLSANRDIGEEEEADIGKDYASLLVGAAPLVRNDEVQRYVNRVGRWVSLHSERPNLNWQFGVLDSDNINAFSTPGGYVFVTRGLLVRMKSEAELAGVLAHEVSHVVKKHHLNAMRKSTTAQAGTDLFSDLAAQQGQRYQAAKNRLVGGMKEVMLRGLDRDDELEADRMGVVLASRSGYDPYGLPAVLQTLQRMNPQDSELALMFATHPDPGTRLDALERVTGVRLDSFATQPQAAERFASEMSSK
jgi:beta-barrel assembly-enhancing protease